MFKRNDIIKLVDNKGLSATKNALAIVIKNQIPNSDFIDIKWLDITSNLKQSQTSGGYATCRFEFVSKGNFGTFDVVDEIYNEIRKLTIDDLAERFINILGEFDTERLENILEDLKGTK